MISSHQQYAPLPDLISHLPEVANLDLTSDKLLQRNFSLLALMDEPRRLPDPLTTWIHFRVPVSYDVNNLESSSDESKTLVAAITPVLRAQGHRRAAWGRVQSDHELTILFSGKISNLFTSIII